MKNSDKELGKKEKSAGILRFADSLRMTMVDFFTAPQNDNLHFLKVLADHQTSVRSLTTPVIPIGAK